MKIYSVFMKIDDLLFKQFVMAFGHDASFHILPSHILMTGIPESSGFLTHVYMTTWVYIVPRLFFQCVYAVVCVFSRSSINVVFTQFLKFLS
jgi:hypothetical protein